MKNKRMCLSKQFCGERSSSGLLESLSFEIGSHVDQSSLTSSKYMGDDLEFLILLFGALKCWDYIPGIPHLIWIRGFLEFQ